MRPWAQEPGLLSSAQDCQAKASHSPASNPGLTIQELCASGNPLSGPGFHNCHMRRLLRPTLQGWWEDYKALCAKSLVKHVDTERPSAQELSTQYRTLPLACALPGETWLSCSQSQGFAALTLGACRPPSSPTTVGLCPNPSPSPGCFNGLLLG